MIWDTLLLRNELDMLELRLTEFEEYGADVQHVLVESAVDFHGRDKPLAYVLNEDRFARWQHRIFHIAVARLPDSPDPWVREHAQRDAMCGVLNTVAADDDLVLICDVDEIPSRQVLDYQGTPAGLLMRTCHSAVDWVYPTPMPGSVVCSARYVRGKKLSAVRDGRPEYPMIQDGGWHLSWLGGMRAQGEKLAVSCHLELPDTERDIIEGGHGYRTGHHVGVDMVPVEVDESWPRFIRDRKCPPSWFRPR